MTFGIDKRYDALLDAIEDLERRSLAVGDVDGSADFDTLTVIAEPFFGDDAEDAVETLVEAALLHRVSTARGAERFRSRFAETMRLLVRTRQMFPGEAWRGAPPLVADFRVDLRRRRYPDRNRRSVEILDQLTGLSALQRRIWQAISPKELAGFQERAAQLLLEPAETDRAAIVTAGTGSGKTLAFYLPVFAALAEQMDESAWVKALAIYPRNELLKDQLSEAYQNAERCADVLVSETGRPLRLATFYGDTPYRADVAMLSKAWLARGEDRLCPFLRCRCNGEMHWKRPDLEAAREILTCVSCGAKTSEAKLALTRQSALRHPPDILFTTTEMLNRSLSDPRRWPLFGVARPKGRRPSFLLLDEVHTYNGVSGAQVALTLRRWRSFHGGPITWIGLSATLAEAPQFFSDLTGAALLATSEITPLETEMIEEGREYQIALRGDPVSQTSLLSTAIQSLMLMGRILDPANGGKSEGRFGKRLFAFTDDLDVVQRLFDDLRDAEAYNAFGRADGAREPLAAMRAPALDGESPSERRARDLGGQRWSLPEAVGRPVDRRLTIARTSSRDPGVDSLADAVIATSALEVGFNDTTVGAVVQYKAPLNFASFLQRKGRAGRTRAMRPIMLTILSDYGRDRQLFQGFEHLFEPTLDRQTLPIGNQYILRMQAAFAFLDWCGSRLAANNVQPTSMWRMASTPAETARESAQSQALQTLISRLVQGEPGLVSDLRSHLKSALGAPDEVIDRLLWQPPRSLLLEVVPTLLSRLYRNWDLAWPTPDRLRELHTPDHPLPEFVPRALFSELNLPDIEFVLPPHRQGQTETLEPMPIQQALGQFIPGRVSRRFGENYGGLAHWFPVPRGVNTFELAISDYAGEQEPLGEMEGFGPDGWVSMPVYRPWRIRLQKAVPETVKPTSNAYPIWASGFRGLGVPVKIPAPARTAWRHLVDGVELYLQQHRASVGLHRFAMGSRAEIRRSGGELQTVNVRFTQAGAPAAIGFAFETDGLALRLNLPSDEALSSRVFPADIDRGLRVARFRRLVAEDLTLPDDCNIHERRWLSEIYLVAVSLRAIARDASLVETANTLEKEGDPTFLENAMDRVLGLQAVIAVPDEGDGSEEPTSRSEGRLDRLRASVRNRISHPSTRRSLHAALCTAFDNGVTWGRFLRRTLDATLADALLAAAITATPRHSATDALIADFETDPNDLARTTVWLTETTVGGAGVLQSLAEPFASEPRRLFAALEAALEPGDLEAASDSLARIYQLAGRDSDLKRLIDDVRAEHGHVERSVRRSALFEALTRHGFDVGRALSVSLNARMLSPDANPAIDDVVRALLVRWERLEARLGVELTARDLAALVCDDPEINALAEHAGLVAAHANLGERTNALSALLWPKSSAVRRDALLAYNRYRTTPDVEPAIVRTLLLKTATESISLEDADWLSRSIAALRENAALQIWAPAHRADLLRMALIGLPATPIALGHLVLYPSLERVSREPDRLMATFVLKEQL
ncbi:protein DpdJ [Brevundimonas diminuta]|uniref:protein DpdJ n=1 Tax=Brevundimonas diminuta TaxID=293 RepID=UPI003F817E05